MKLNQITLFILCFELLSGCSSERTLTNFRAVHFRRAVAFSWTGEILDQEIVVRKKLNPRIVNYKSVELTKGQIAALEEILIARDTLKLIPIMECFAPKAGIVFYTSKGVAENWITVDFECNQLHSSFEIDKADLSGLSNFFRKLNF